jgi:hypothetical protein
MPMTLNDARDAADAAVKQRDVANAARKDVIEAKDQAAAQQAIDRATAAATEAARQSVTALQAAVDVSTVAARDFAETARDAAVAAESAVQEAKDVFSKKQ